MRRYHKKEPKYPQPTHPSHLLISFDLGKRKVGLAVFLCNGGSAKLIGAETVKLDGDWSAEAMASEVHTCLSPMLSQAFIPAVLVCEWPQKYATARKFHKNLDDLYDVGHAIVRAFSTPWAETYTPAEWKGNVPKRAHKKRLSRELSMEEKVTLQKHTAQSLDIPLEEAVNFLESDISHDLWDAIGIGLFATARARKGGTRV